VGEDLGEDSAQGQIKVQTIEVVQTVPQSLGLVPRFVAAGAAGLLLCICITVVVATFRLDYALRDVRGTRAALISQQLAGPVPQAARLGISIGTSDEMAVRIESRQRLDPDLVGVLITDEHGQPEILSGVMAGAQLPSLEARQLVISTGRPMRMSRRELILYGHAIVGISGDRLGSAWVAYASIPDTVRLHAVRRAVSDASYLIAGLTVSILLLLWWCALTCETYLSKLRVTKEREPGTESRLAEGDGRGD
jgi:hypothetical protein